MRSRARCAGRSAGEDSRQTLELYGPPQVAVVVAAEPLPDGSAVATIEDVSDRRRVDAVRTDFVANISHELKTPVGRARRARRGAGRRGRHQRRAPRRRAHGRRVAPRRPHDRRPHGAVPHRARRASPCATRCRWSTSSSGAIDRASPLVRGAPHRRRRARRARRRRRARRPSPAHARRSATWSRTRSSTPRSAATSRSGSGSPTAAPRGWQLRRADGGRPGHRHPGGRPRPDLRALLPSRQGPQPRHRRHRTRPVDRPPRRDQPRRRGARVVAGGRGLDVRAAHPARAAASARVTDRTNPAAAPEPSRPRPP